MDRKPNFNGDLEFGKGGENHLKNILESVEVKTDRETWRTGNVAVEFEWNGKPSGIAISNAKYWTFILDGDYKKEVHISIELERLKSIARKYFKNARCGGDNNLARIILIPIQDIIRLKPRGPCYEDYI